LSSIVEKLPIEVAGWRRLNEKLAAGGDLLQIAANCFLLIEAHKVEAYNARVGKPKDYEAIRLAVWKSLPETGFRAAITVPPTGIVAVAATWTAICEALITRLSSLAEPIRQRASDEFGAVEVLIGVERPGPVRRKIKTSPQRIQDEISDLPSVLHPGLHIHRARVDGIELIARPVSGETTRYLERLSGDSPPLRVMVAPLTKTAQLAGRSFDPVPPHPARGFILTSTGDLEAELAELDRAFAQCHGQNAAILVLPELRMPPELDRRLRELLDAQDPVRVLLVAAGSWHVAEGTGWRNRCKLYDHRGEAIFEHDKLAEFRLTPDNLKKNPALREALCLDEHGGFENVLRGERLRFCDTPIGRITLAICAGFFAEPVRAALKTARADLYLVPAMSPKCELLDKFADELAGHHGGSTAVANCGTVGGGAGSFVRSALLKATAAGQSVCDLLS
jgi:hypothetical protein